MKPRPWCWVVSCQNRLQQLNDQTPLPELKRVFLLQVAPDMKAGLWMICQACRERNYLHAYDIYMRLAIGEGLHDITPSAAFWAASALRGVTSACPAAGKACVAMVRPVRAA